MLVHNLVTLSYKPVQQSQTHNRWLHCISAGQCFYNDMRFPLRVKARTSAHHSAYTSQPCSLLFSFTVNLWPPLIPRLFLTSQKKIPFEPRRDIETSSCIFNLIFLDDILECKGESLDIKRGGCRWRFTQKESDSMKEINRIGVPDGRAYIFVSLKSNQTQPNPL